MPASEIDENVQFAHQQDIVMHMCSYTWLELITISIVTVWSIWHNATADFLCFGKFPPQIYESCGAAYRQNYETFSVL